MEELFAALFDRPARRKHILCWWHIAQPVKGETLVEVLLNFIKVILYAPECIELTPTELRVFRNQKGLTIKYKFMDPKEIGILRRVFIDKDKLFGSVERYQSSEGWKICKYKNSGLMTQKRRREIVRDFVFILLSQQKSARSSLIAVTQLLVEREKKRGDVFITNVHDKLQYIGDINKLQAVYDEERV